MHSFPLASARSFKSCLMFSVFDQVSSFFALFWTNSVIWLDPKPNPKLLPLYSNCKLRAPRQEMREGNQMQLLFRHDFFKDIIGMIPEAAQLILACSCSPAPDPSLLFILLLILLLRSAAHPAEPFKVLKHIRQIKSLFPQVPEPQTLKQTKQRVKQNYIFTNIAIFSKLN